MDYSENEVRLALLGLVGGPRDALGQADLVADVEAALGRLDKSEQQALTLEAFGCTQREIAALVLHSKHHSAGKALLDRAWKRLCEEM